MRQGLVRTLDGTARSKGKTRTGRGQWMILPVWRHTAKNCESTATLWYNCGQWRHLAKSCLEKEYGKQGKGESKGGHTEKGKRQNGQRLVVESERKGKGKMTPKHERMGRMGPH